MSEYAPLRVYNETPIVQFRTLNQFVVDLAAGQIDVVYHDIGAGAIDSAPWTSSFRAIVTTTNGTHIASVSFRCPPLTVVGKRGYLLPAADEEQYTYQAAEHNALVSIVRDRLAENGILSLREGLIDLPFWLSLTYARRPATP